MFEQGVKPVLTLFPQFPRPIKVISKSGIPINVIYFT